MAEQIVFGIRIEGIDGTIRNQQQLTDAIKETKKQLAGKDIDSPQYKKLQKTLGQLTASQKNFRKETRDQAREAQAGAKGVTGAYRALSAQLAVSRERMKDLAAAGRTGSSEFKKLSKEVTMLDGRLKRIDASAGQFQRSVGNYRSALGGLGQFGGGIAQAGLGPMAGLVAGPAMAGMATITALVAGSRTIFDFEQGMQDLRAITDATDSQMKAFEKTARDLGGSTAFTAEQVLGLQTELSKLGFSVNQVNAMAESVINLSTALDAEAAEAAELLGGQLRSFNKDASEAAQMADVMAAAASNSALDFRKLQVMLPQVSTVGNKAGETFESMVAKLGMLANANLDASTAATGLRNVYLKNAEAGRTYDEGLSKIRTSTDSLATATEMYGTRSAVVALILAELEVETAKLQETLELSNGELERMNRQKLDSVRGDTLLLNSAFTELILAINTANSWFTKFIRNTIKGATGLVKAVTQIARFGQILGEQFDEDLNRFDKVAQIQIKRYTEFVKTGQMTTEEFIENINEQIAAKERSLNADRGLEAKQRALLQAGLDNLRVIKEGVLEAVTESAPVSDELQKLIDRLNKEVEELDSDTEKATKTIDEFVKGSLRSYREELSALNKELDKYSVGTDEWIRVNKEIGEAEENLRLFTQRAKDIREDNLGQGETGVLPTLSAGSVSGSGGFDSLLADHVDKFTQLANAEIAADAEAKEKKKEKLREYALFAIDIAQEIANAQFAIARNNIERETNLALNQLDFETQQKLSKVDQGSAEENAILEEQRRKELEITQEAAKKQKQIDIQQAIINGALAITKTFATVPFPASLIAAAFVGAQTLAQLSVIRSTGFAEGGFTGHGGKYDPAGTVHKGEVVWSQRDVAAVGGPTVADRMRPTYKGYADGGMVGSFTGGVSGGSITDREIRAIEAATERGTRKGTMEGTKEASKERSRLQRLQKNISV